MINPSADTQKGYMRADVEFSEDNEIPFSNATLIWFKTAKPAEAILRLDQDIGILITVDSLQNTPHPDEHHNLLARIMMQSKGLF